MSVPTVVADDAETLVREGGVLSLAHQKAYSDPWLGLASNEFESVGTVRVVDVHHADDCAVGGIYAKQRFRCSPDARPNHWHWIVEPVADGVLPGQFDAIVGGIG